MPRPSQDWWEVSQMGHSGYQIHLQAEVVGHSCPSALCLCCSTWLCRPGAGTGVAELPQEQCWHCCLIHIYIWYPSCSNWTKECV